MSKATKLAEVFPPGEYIADELSARGWSQGDLARIIGRPLQAVNMIINARKRITPETALELEAALGISAGLWVRMDAEYWLSKAELPSKEIVRRAAKLSGLVKS